MDDVPSYRREEVPPYLLTSQELLDFGRVVKSSRQPDGYLLVELYDTRALPQIPAAAPQQESTDRSAAVEWAQQVLSDPDTVLLDTECTDFTGRIIEIAIVRPTGEVLLETLVNPKGEPIAAAARAKHGITDEMVAAPGTPTFAELHELLLAFLTGKRIVCWNVAFDQARLTEEANRLLPFYSKAAETPWVEARWEDAMLQHAAWVGERDSSGQSYRRHRLNGGHRALGDCQVMLQRLIEMAGHELALAAAPTVSSPSRRIGGPWSAEEEATLDELHRSGMTEADIAKHLQRTVNAVRWRLHDLGRGGFPSDLVPAHKAPPKPPPACTMEDRRKVHRNAYKPWSSEEDQQLVLRHNEGATPDQLAQEFGRKPSAITSRLAKLSI